MDPVTLTVTAVAAGAAAGMKDTAKQAISDAYAALKALLIRRHGDLDLSPVENQPDSEEALANLTAELHEHQVVDETLRAAAQRLVDAVGSEPAIGIDLEEVEAAALHAERVWSTGTAARIRKSKFEGDITLTNLRAGGAEGSGPF